MKEENLEKPCECIHCGGIFPTKDAAHHKCPPHQREKEILEDIASVNGVKEYKGKEYYSSEVNVYKLASYLYKLESRLDDLYKILTPSQRMEIEQHKTPL